MMNDLESFYATTEHRRPGRVLYETSFTPDLKQRLIEHIGTEDIGAHYGFCRKAALGMKRPKDLPPLDYSRYWEEEDLPEGTQINSFGVAQVPSGFYHFFGYVSPLRNASCLEEIEEYPLDDMSGWDVSHMKPLVDQAHAQGKIAVGFVGHMYETAWQIRGYEQFLMDMIERPSWAECLLQRLADQNMVKAVAFARAGADLIRCGDDVANQNTLMFSPDMWRGTMHSRWAAVWRAVKEIHPAARVWYHSDGNVIDIVPDLVDAGLDILNPVQPECLDADAIHAEFGDRLTFDGCIGTQSTMPHGTPDEVRARVKEVIDRYGSNGGLMIAPTHILEPEVPIENIDAMVEACREYGTFE